MDTLNRTRLPDRGWAQHFEIVQELGDCYVQLGDYEQARDCYEKAAALEPDEAGPYVGTGIIALQQGKLADAQLAFRVALRLNPQSSKAYAGQAMISHQRGHMQEAFELYLKCLDLDSDNLTALLGLFQVSCAMGSFGRVIEYLKVYLGMHPGDTSVMFCLATLYLKDQKPKIARELLMNILQLEPANTDAANLLEEVEHRLAQN
ncbi:MAG: tetratricopeptide repeat protein [Planctomycetaceae bacterium]|nr:tetratricopeptide repeat protein [Planctomycetaceae bacterium]